MSPILPTKIRGVDEDTADSRPAGSFASAPAPAEAVLGLQRSVGNRGVTRSMERRRLARQPATATQARAPSQPAHTPWTEQTTGDNSALAKEIDELEKLDMEEYRRRRDITEIRAADPSDAHYEDYKRSLDAFEFLEARRIAPMRVRKEILNEDYDGGSHRIRHRNVRVVIEQGVQQTGSLRQSIKGTDKPKAIENDIFFIERDAERFGDRFLAQAKEFAREMLAQSADEILREIRKYGLRRSSALDAANEILHGRDRDKVVREVVNADAVWDPDTDGAGNPGAARQWRMGLGAEVTKLKQQQRAVQALREDLSHQFKHTREEIYIPDPVEYAAVKQRLAESEKRLAATWARSERKFKVLGGFRRGDVTLADVDLGALDDGTTEGHPQMTDMLKNLVQKLADIGTIQDRIHRGNLSPLSLPPVVAVTKAAMFVPDGSIRAGKVNDMVEDAQDSGVAKYIAEGLLALIVLATLIPSGGATLPVAIGLVGAALSATSAVEDWETYQKRKLLANTALNRANALSAEDPSLLPFAIDLISLGLDGLPLVKAFGEVVALRNLVRARQEAANADKLTKILNELDALGATKQDPHLGEQLLKDVQSAEREAGASARSAASSSEWRKPPGQPYETADELRAAIRDELKALKHGDINMNSEWIELVQADWDELIRLHPDNRWLFENLEKVYFARRDPKRIEDLFVKLYNDAARQRISPPKALVRHFGGARDMYRIPRNEASGEAFRKALLKPKPPIDLAFVSDDHGALTHMFDLYLLEDVLGEAEALRFRHAIADLKGEIRRDNGEMKQLYGAVWDALFDSLDEFDSLNPSLNPGQINRPEVFGPILRKHLGFTKGKPRP